MSNQKSLLGIFLSLLVAFCVMVALSHGSAKVEGMPVIAICCLIAFGVQWLMFIPAFLLKTEHFYDATGSLTHITVVLVAIISIQTVSLRDILIALLVVIWAARLGSFLFFRVRDAGGDVRFSKIKHNFLMFLMTWTLQGLWVFLTLSMALAAITSSLKKDLDVFAWVGAGVWLFGFIFEVVADHQKTKFRKDSNNKGTFITKGLWSWCRHPNYFGEIVLWVGIAILTAPVLAGWQWVGLISPVFVTFLLLRVSGVGLLEAQGSERWGHDPEYQSYLTRTSILIPFPPSSRS